MNDNVPLSEQPFISHLIELRDRLLRMVIAVIALLMVLFPFGNDIFHLLAQPVMNALPEGNSMIATKVLSPFLTPLKLAFVASVFLAMPYLLYQLWSFIAPGLYQHEKRLAMPLLVSSIILFYLGAAFAYFVVLPLLFPFLVGVTPKDVEVMPDIADYLDIAIRLFFAFGLAFEVPIATILLVLAKATTPEKLKEKRPYVIVGAFVIGMLLTPPDIISQTMLAVPMWVLFELGLVISRMLVRAREQHAGEADADEDAPAASAAPGAAAAGAAAGAGTAAATAGTPDDGDFRPLNESEMEDEFDRIEAEFDALPDSIDDGAGADAVNTDTDEDVASAGDEAGSGGDQPGWSSDDSADMLDEEETFPQRSAIEALVDSKLEQVAALRNTGAYDEARRLLYEVLSEGNETQVKVARNILEQLDS
ncbi:MAG: twin-arginine translocase subunit TatC [Gammaproteobacteria bacterium]|nr:twin-arginine translocase subunit TatC [Gammaproteobacteria bacterium]